MNKFYKIKLGYENDNYLSINENELPKAIILFLEGNGRGLFEEGTVRGRDIMQIKNDWHKLRGWNKSWKMTDGDYADVQHLEKSYRETYQLAECVAKEIIKQNRRELLSENKSLKELEEIVLKGLSGGVDIKKLK